MSRAKAFDEIKGLLAKAATSLDLDDYVELLDDVGEEIDARLDATDEDEDNDEDFEDEEDDE